MKRLKMDYVICTNKIMQICWLLDDIPYPSILYLYSDHSWYFHPETARKIQVRYLVRRRCRGTVPLRTHCGVFFLFLPKLCGLGK